MDEKRILVVDDQEVIREMFKTAFERAGHTVLTSGSAEEALDIMSKTPCSVLFLDLDLPGMNGIELCRIVRQKWPMSVPYAVTGYTTLYQLVECREAGFEDYFPKPVRMSTLQDAAARAFEKIDRWKLK